MATSVPASWRPAHKKRILVGELATLGKHLMWRPHTFKITRFETEIGEPRLRNSGLDMCRPLQSLVSRLVPLLLGIKFRFQLQSKMEVSDQNKRDQP